MESSGSRGVWGFGYRGVRIDGGEGALKDFSGIYESNVEALNVYIRQRSIANHAEWFESARGEVHYSTVCVYVRRLGVVYPSAIVLLTLFFFVWVVTWASLDQTLLPDIK